MGVGALEARRNDISVLNLGLPASLSKVLAAMLRADPAKRPTDVVPLFRTAIENLQKQGSKTKIGTAEDKQTPKTSNTVKWVAAVILVGLVGVGLVFQISGASSVPPASLTTKEFAERVLAGEDPLRAVAGLIEQGGEQNLEASFAVLKSMSLDRALPDATRISALLGVARMYDPETHSMATSPFPQPNAATARREYQRAADLGSDTALRAVQRLQNSD